MRFLSSLFGRRADPPVPRARRLIVGLGNPGPDYADTRHNAGFMVADRVAEAAGLRFAAEAGRALLAEGAWRGVPFAVAKPLTFMNRSGESVVALLRRYGLTAADVLVVYDDIALPLGAVRLREKGSAGGHNGVQDVADRLGGDAFPRLRVGVGSDFPRGAQVHYVLAPFRAEERAAAEAAVALAAEAALAFVHDGLAAAMNRYNRRGAESGRGGAPA